MIWQIIGGIVLVVCIAKVSNYVESIKNRVSDLEAEVELLKRNN